MHGWKREKENDIKMRFKERDRRRTGSGAAQESGETTKDTIHSESNQMKTTASRCVSPKASFACAQCGADTLSHAENYEDLWESVHVSL